MNNTLQYKKLSPEEMQKRRILGRLIGICADFKNATRNGRLYSEALWDKVFSNPIMKEKIANRCVYGELGHPADRTEMDMEKIAICMAEQPQKGSDGKLRAVFDILDTPNGRILKTLCDYGTQIGISSRGQGDTYTDYDGKEKVDPDTYDCEGFDVVILPAVKEARLKYVTESLNTQKTLAQALQESFANASAEDKKIMNETWNQIAEDIFPEGEVVNDKPEAEKKEILNERPVAEDVMIPNAEINADVDITINGDVEPEIDDKDVQIPEESDENNVYNNMNESSSWTPEELKLASEQMKKLGFMSYEEFLDTLEKIENQQQQNADDHIEKEIDEEAAEDNGDLLIDELQNSLEENLKLKKDIKNLQEQLSVCYAKENRLEGKILIYKKSITNLTESNKQVEPLKAKINSLTEDLTKKNETIANNLNMIDELNSKLSTMDGFKKSLSENYNEGSKQKEIQISKLTEAVNNKQAEINKLNAQITAQNNSSEKLQSKIATLTKSNSELKESLSDLGEALKTEKSKLIKQNQSLSNEILREKKLNENLVLEKAKVEDELAMAKKDSDIAAKRLNEKLEKQISLTTKYKSIAQKSVDKYIESHASRIGVKPVEIRNKLTESYTFNDIDRVVEELQDQNLRINKLPFNTSLNSARIKVTESLDPLVRDNARQSADEVDDQLLRLAGLLK